MENISVALMLLSVLLFLVGIVILIVKAIRRKRKMPAVLTVLLSVALFVLSVAVMPTGSSTPSGKGSEEDSYSDTEVFAAEFCMAYMNCLKNPYSFTVKYIWANDAGDGKYEVYVKFTAENAVGGTITEEIATLGSLDYDDLNELAQGGDYVNVHTWGSEPTGKILGKGQELDADSIQAYIDKNYN